MNEAEDKRNKHISLMRDYDLLRALLSDSHAVDLNEGELSKFADMLECFRSRKQDHLSIKQRAWAEEVARRVFPLKAGEVPRGRPVPTPGVLQNLPKRPPGR